MRVEFRTLKGAISTLVILCVLFIGMGLDVSAHQRRGRNWERSHDRGRNWGRSHNRGRHLGWTRGRRVGQRRHDDDSNWRRRVRRDRRDRRSSWDDGRSRRRDRVRQTGTGRNRF